MKRLSVLCCASQRIPVAAWLLPLLIATAGCSGASTTEDAPDASPSSGQASSGQTAASAAEAASSGSPPGTGTSPATAAVSPESGAQVTAGSTAPPGQSVAPATETVPGAAAVEPGATSAQPSSVPESRPDSPAAPAFQARSSGRDDRQADPEAAAAALLERQLSELTIPPAWLADVTSSWNRDIPWKEARQEIRRLLGRGDDASRREGVRLMWDYRQKGDMGDGHEYGMYLFLGDQPLWAIHAFRERLAESGRKHKYPPYFEARSLASLYVQRGLFSQAEAVLRRALDWSPPDAAWTEMRQAGIHDALGDLYAAWGRLNDARTHYRRAVQLYPQGKPPYGRHLLPRRAKKVQAKLDLLSVQSLAGTALKDGTWTHTALGYSGDVRLTVRVENGRIAAIDVEHQEKIDQNAATLIPQRIIDAQSLAVDGVSGATVTKDAIVTGTLEALRKAGLK